MSLIFLAIYIYRNLLLKKDFSSIRLLIIKSKPTADQQEFEIDLETPKRLEKFSFQKLWIGNVCHSVRMSHHQVDREGIIPQEKIILETTTAEPAEHSSRHPDYEKSAKAVAWLEYICGNQHKFIPIRHFENA